MTDGDAKFEEFVRKTAGDYNAPPAEVPRDEMWGEIRRQRNGRRVRGPARGLQSRWWMGMAATLLIGVALGRFALRSSTGAVAGAPADAASVAVAPRPEGDNVALRMATADHLVRAEALLTAYGTAVRADAAIDAQMTAWARDVLSNTRLLLDSPAPMDPARRMLLRDLEAVLMQLSQPSPLPGTAGRAEEREMINRNLERTHMLPRLRSAVPPERTRGT